jgi:hypothetical protein
MTAAPLDELGVTGSSPVAPTKKAPGVSRRLSSSASAALVAQGLEWPSWPSDWFSRELVPQTGRLLERANAIEYRERLLREVRTDIR